MSTAKAWTIQTGPTRVESARTAQRSSLERIPQGYVRALLIAAVVLRMALVWATAGLPTRIVDEQHYQQLATSLARGGGFAFEAGEPTSIRPPLYPAFVALIWRIIGTESLTPIRSAQVALSLVSVGLLYLIGRELFDHDTAVRAAVAFALYPPFVFFGVVVLTEVLFLSLLLATMYGCVRLLTRAQSSIALATGASLGLAALTRSIMWPFPLLLIPFMACAMAGPMRTRAKACAALLLGFVLVIAPWTIRNTRLQHTFTVVDSMGGLNLLMGNYEHTPEDRMWDAVSLTGDQSWSAPLRAEKGAAVWTEGQKEKWAQRQAVRYMAAHPLTTMRRAVLKFADLWGLDREWIAGLQQGLYHPPTWFALLSGALMIGAFPALVIVAAVGVWMEPPSNRAQHWLLVMLILFVTGIHTVTFGHSRYHFPLVPILVLYAAAACRHPGTLLQRARSARGLASCVTVLMALSVWAHELLLRDAGRVTELLSAWSGAR